MLNFSQTNEMPSMLEELITRSWLHYTEVYVPELKGERLRLASGRCKASHFLYPPAQPTGEVCMLSNVDVHCGWECPVNLRWAKSLNIKEQSTTLRELQSEALGNAIENGSYPYLWWFYPLSNPKKRAVYVDSIGVSFIKLGGVWQVLYNCKALGTLVGAQGHSGDPCDYERLPPNAYFVVMENEATARHPPI